MRGGSAVVVEGGGAARPCAVFRVCRGQSVCEGVRVELARAGRAGGAVRQCGVLSGHSAHILGGARFCVVGPRGDCGGLGVL